MNIFNKPTVKGPVIKTYAEPLNSLEQAKKQQRELKTVQRDLNREDEQLAREEKKLEAEIKNAAKQGNEAATKNLAKQLIKVRNMRQKNSGVKSQSNFTVWIVNV